MGNGKDFFLFFVLLSVPLFTWINYRIGGKTRVVKMGLNSLYWLDILQTMPPVNPDPRKASLFLVNGGCLTVVPS